MYEFLVLNDEPAFFLYESKNDCTDNQSYFNPDILI